MINLISSFSSPKRITIYQKAGNMSIGKDFFGPNFFIFLKIFMGKTHPVSRKYRNFNLLYSVFGRIISRAQRITKPRFFVFVGLRLNLFVSVRLVGVVEMEISEND